MTGTQLPQPGEPLTLADGTKISPDTGEVISDGSYVEVPRGSEAQAQITYIKHKLADLPAPPKQMNVVSVVLFYNMLGVSDEEIASATGLTEAQVGQVRMSDVYDEFRSIILKQIQENDADNIRGMFQANAVKAARKVATLVDSPNSAIALTAAKDMLDRAGHRPADTVNHNLNFQNGFRIEVVTKDNDPIVPTIDLSVEND